MFDISIKFVRDAAGARPSFGAHRALGMI